MQSSHRSGSFAAESRWRRGARAAFAGLCGLAFHVAVTVQAEEPAAGGGNASQGLYELGLRSLLLETADRPGGPLYVDHDQDGLRDLYVASFQPAHPSRPAEALSEHWIGLTGNPVDDLLRTHLTIPEGQGLLVTQVVEDSPAARAGVKVHDILLAAGDKPLKEIGDLAALIESGKDARLALRLIRGGKPIIIEVHPERRPPSQTGETCPVISKLPDADFVRRLWTELLEKTPGEEQVQSFVDDQDAEKRGKLASRLLRQSQAASRSCAACHRADAETVRLYDALLQPLARRGLGNRLNPQMQGLGMNPWLSQLGNITVQPGIVWDPASGLLRTTITLALPDDLEITIARKGSEPARITAKRGEQSWEALDSDYNLKLPEDIRPHVEKMLSGLNDSGASRWQALWMNRLNQTAAPSVTLDHAEITQQAPVAAAATPADALSRLARQLEALTGQMNDLRQTVQDLQQALSTQKPAEEKK